MFPVDDGGSNIAGDQWQGFVSPQSTRSFHDDQSVLNASVHQSHSIIVVCTYLMQEFHFVVCGAPSRTELGCLQG